MIEGRATTEAMAATQSGLDQFCLLAGIVYYLQRLTGPDMTMIRMMVSETMELKAKI